MLKQILDGQAAAAGARSGREWKQQGENFRLTVLSDVMRKTSNIILAVSLGLGSLALIFLVTSRMDTKAQDREMGFVGALHNSLYYLDQAKWKWAEENHIAEQNIPTMVDLAPYLGKWTNTITRLESLGVNYTITPFSDAEPQSDIATFTREVYFHVGFCRYYPAGCRYCLHTGWTSPELKGSSRLRAIYFADREILSVSISFLTTVNLFILAAVKLFKKLRAR